MDELPEYHFRARENGAAVFRVEGGGQHRRLDFVQIAAVNLRSGEIRPQGGRTLTEADRDAISAWAEARRATLAARELDDIHRLIDRLSEAAHWAQTRATPEQLDAVEQPLLMAMHDLRAVLTRKKGERLLKARGEG
jgi:hypothetical protein